MRTIVSKQGMRGDHGRIQCSADTRVSIIGRVSHMSDASKPPASGECREICDSPWSVVKALDTAIAVTQPDGAVIFANPPLSDLTGMPLATIVGSPVFTLFDRERRDELGRLHAAALMTSAAQRAAAHALSGTDTTFAARVVMRRCDRPDGHFIVWSISAAGNITPRKRPPVANPGVRNLDPLLDLALRGTEIGLWAWDIATDSLTWINNWCEQWGLTAFEGSGHERLWTARLHEGDQRGYWAALESHLAGETHIFDFEYRVRSRRDTWVWVQERGRVIERDATGRGLRMVGLCLNVDERHHTAEALEQSESRFQLAVWGTQVGFWNINAATDEMRWWNDWCANMDLDPCEGFGHLQRWNARIHPDDLPFTMSFEGLLEGRTDLYEAEYRLRTRAGGWRWVLCRGRATRRDNTGRALQIAGVTIDIDARKRAEIALRESEARLAAAIGGTGLGLWESDQKKGCSWSKDSSERFDVDLCEGPDWLQHWIERIHPDDLERYTTSDEDTARGSTDSYAVEYRILTRSGAWRWLHERGNVIARDNAGIAQRYVGVVFDIDEQKKMEVALRKAEDRYDLAVNAAQLPVWEYDQATDTVTGNIYWHRAVGHDLTEAEALQRKETWLSDIHPEDITRHECVYRDRAVDDDGLCQSEFRIKLPNGDYRWLLDRARVVERAADGQPLKVVGISVDIDAQKRLQAALREGEARLETAIGGSDIGLWDWAVGSDALRWLSDWPLRKGIKATLQPSTYPELLASTHPEDRERLDADARAVISGGRDVIEMDYRIQSLRGEWLWLQVRAKVVERDRSGRPQRIVGACIDVDARRRAEEMRRTQATILETMREGIVLIDLAGRIELSNPAFDRMVGYAVGELAGSSIGTLLSGGQAGQPHRTIERLVEGLRHQTGTYDILFRRRDGTEFTGEVVTAAIELASGKRWLAVVQDVSDRKRLEQEVLDIANRERRRFGHELHDGLCQELTGVALMLRSMATHLHRHVLPTHRQIEDLIALVTGAIDSARAMAHGLSPVTLDRGGLVSALSALAHRARESYGINVRLRLKVPRGLTIDEATASHLYRIAQEAINNAAKHGHASAITVALRAHDDKVQLSVSDDGIGLPAGAVHGPGMGLKIMAYRARMISGVIDVAPRPGGGTRVQCVCPALARAAGAAVFGIVSAP
jgi:PAS domain S-box-containing protein